MKLRKTIKIVLGLMVFITLPSLLLYGFAYFKYNDKIPEGKIGIEADALALKMQNALNIEAFHSTKHIEFTARKSRHYEWEKSKDICTIFWKEFKVELNLKNPDSSLAYIHSFIVTGNQKEDLTKKAKAYFQKDTFWLIAPYLAFDSDVERKLVTSENNTKSLLITHLENKDIPVKSYQWLLDSQGKPTAFKMWDSSLPIDGLTATWNDWTITESGAQLSTFHKILFFGIDLSNIIGTQ